MKTITIEEDVFQFILKRVADTGKNPSEVLRQALNLSPPEMKHSNSNKKIHGNLYRKSEELIRFLDSTQLRAENTVVGKSLKILSFLYKQNPDKFTVVEKVSGRARVNTLVKAAKF